VVLENVPFMLQLAGGQALEVIVCALEKLGYRWAYRVVDARAFGVPQRRRRVFFVASLEEDPRRVLFADDRGTLPDKANSQDLACGFYWTEGVRGLGWAVDAVPTLKGGSTIGVPSPPAIWFPDGRIATPDIRDVERLQGFRAGWTKPATTVAREGMRWKLAGNAVCVPVARWLGKRLSEPGNFVLDGVRPLAANSSWPDVAWNLGDGRFTANVSAWPKHTKRPSLIDFLKYPTKPLSARATAGFLRRTEKGTLRFPAGFIAALEAHHAQVVASDGQSQGTQLSDSA
jgi:DNA (cytosine-5)-methyltransferase 1